MQLVIITCTRSYIYVAIAMSHLTGSYIYVYNDCLHCIASLKITSFWVIAILRLYIKILLVFNNDIHVYNCYSYIFSYNVYV